MFTAVKNRYLVPFQNDFLYSESQTRPPKNAPDKSACKKMLKKQIKKLRLLQKKLYASDQFSVLLVFQAMDAGGKDSTIRAVMSGINPAGCQVFSFKQPSKEELDHDFLWRSARCLPERGRIGIFNRSYYEEVLVVRVHPEFLTGQKLPYPIDHKKFWRSRFESIVDHEKHLAKNGTIILKFWLNVSKEEQKQRFLSRIEDESKNWKFSFGDVEERKYWDQYMAAFESALKHTSRPWAPWYAIPADDKPFMRLTVAQIIVDSLKQLDLKFPEFSPEEKDRLKEMQQVLASEK